MKPAAAVIALASLALFGRPVQAGAHTTSTGLATLSVTGSTVSYRLTVVPGELPPEPARLLTSAADGDPAAVERVASELRRRIIVRSGDVPCRPGRAQIQGSRLGDGRVTLELALECPAPPARLTIRDGWFELFGEHYRTIARIEVSGAGAREAVFLPDAPEATIEIGQEPAAQGAGFFRLGVEHILTGYDHLLFLLALLLRGGRLLSLLKIITAFTVAHSITLALAVLGVVTIPGRIIEPAIAASVVWVALENLRRDAPSQRWLVSFVFGLVHGFGFASAIEPLGLPPARMALALLGFNLGVEAGQALVVVLLLPLLLWMRGKPWEPRVVRAASLGVAAVGLAWLVARLFFS